MKVIGGLLKGRKLCYLKERNLRPTKNLVREAIFDSLRGWIEGKRVLDLFAGTGALGIEAISHGAEKVIFVESRRKSTEILRENLLNLAIVEKTEVLREQIEVSLKELKGKKFDLILADPPYNYPDEGFSGFLKFIRKENILEEDGIIVLEHSLKRGIPEIAGLCIYKNKKYGNTSVSFIKIE